MTGHFPRLARSALSNVASRDVGFDQHWPRMVTVPLAIRQRAVRPPPLCWWCCETANHDRENRFLLRDGPVDWHFCCEEHARLWLDHRYVPATAELCRTCPADRAEIFKRLGTDQEAAAALLLLNRAHKDAL